MHPSAAAEARLIPPLPAPAAMSSHRRHSTAQTMPTISRIGDAMIARSLVDRDIDSGE